MARMRAVQRSKACPESVEGFKVQSFRNAELATCIQKRRGDSRPVRVNVAALEPPFELNWSWVSVEITLPWRDACHVECSEKYFPFLLLLALVELSDKACRFHFLDEARIDELLWIG